LAHFAALRLQAREFARRVRRVGVEPDDRDQAIGKALDALELVGVVGLALHLHQDGVLAVPHWAKQFPGKNMKAMLTLLETARPDPNAYWKDSSQVNAIIVKHLQASFERNEVSIAEATRLMMTEIRGFLGVR
jgi:hypothetical protein